MIDHTEYPEEETLLKIKYTLTLLTQMLEEVQPVLKKIKSQAEIENSSI